MLLLSNKYPVVASYYLGGSDKEKFPELFPVGTVFKIKSMSWNDVMLETMDGNGHTQATPDLIKFGYTENNCK